MECKVEGCTKKHRSKGLCTAHYFQERRRNAVSSRVAQQIATGLTEERVREIVSEEMEVYFENVIQPRLAEIEALLNI